MSPDKERKIRDLIPVEAVQERDTDLLILEEIKCNRNFTDWLLEKTIGLPDNYDLIGAWHSLTQVGLGESDLAFKLRTGERTLLFFIENKVDADFQPNQADRYRLRGNQEKDNGECDEFHTILFAPKRYITKNKDFDFYLEYEEVRDWFLKQTDLGHRAIYKADILEIAIEKLRRGYTPIINGAVTDFRWAYFNYSNKYFPHLRMTEPKKELPKRTGFIRFKPTDMGLIKNEFIIHKQRGDVDLQLRRHIGNVDELINKYQQKLTGDMEIVQTGKSTSIRIRVPKIDIEGNFNDQLENINIALRKVEAIYEWGKRNL
ncbi:MAG: hypothetical protein AB7K37_03205 [Cyclobacteriaceae bacterium]